MGRFSISLDTNLNFRFYRQGICLINNVVGNFALTFFLPSYFFMSTNSVSNVYQFLFLNRFFYISFLKHFIGHCTKFARVYFFKVKLRG